MLEINNLFLKKLLISVKPSNSKNSGKEQRGFITNWINKDFLELEYLNHEREKDSQYNQYYIMLDRQYMVFDTDDEEAYTLLEEYLLNNKMYHPKSITKSYRGETQNIKHKRHFWFKVDDREEFNFIKEEGQIKFIGGEIFFGNRAYIGEFRNTIIDDIPSINAKTYNEILNILRTEQPKFKIKENEKINIVDSEDDEPKIKEIKEIREIKKETSRPKQTENNIEYILYNLNEKRYTEYSYWIIVYFIFINGNYDLKLFEDWSKQYKNYNPYENEKVLRNIEPKKGYTIATLYFWLKEDNITIFKELSKTNGIFWSLEINNVKIADFYYNLNPDKYIYTYDDGWYEYNENNVLINRNSVPLSLSNQLGRELLNYATEQRNLITPEHPKYEEYMKHYKAFYNKLGSDTFINQTINQLKNSYLQDLTDKLDNTNLFSFNNILYDSKINKFRKIEKNDYITKTTNYKLELKNNLTPKTDETIKQKIYDFLYSLFEDNEIVNYWLEITAKSLFGNDKEQKIYLLNGKGSNGKSLTQNLLRYTLGSYYYVVSSNFFVGSKKKESASPELMNCEGVRYLSISEPDGENGNKFNISELKNMSGNDIIKGRALYSNKIKSIKPTFTIFISCNDLPELSNIDDGIRRRLRNIFYPFQFKEEHLLKDNPETYRKINYDLADVLYKPEFIQNFIVLLLEKYNNCKNGFIKTPKKVLECSNKYCDENNILYDWFNTYIEKTNSIDDKIQAKELLEHYNMSQFCKNKTSHKNFGVLMEKLGISKSIIGRNKNTFYINIKFIEDVEEPEI